MHGKLFLDWANICTSVSGFNAWRVKGKWSHNLGHFPSPTTGGYLAAQKPDDHTNIFTSLLSKQKWSQQILQSNNIFKLMYY